MDLPFDRVVVGKLRFTAAEFMALPVEDRVRYVLQGDLAFFHGSMPIDRMRALNWLRVKTPATSFKPVGR